MPKDTDGLFCPHCGCREFVVNTHPMVSFTCGESMVRIDGRYSTQAACASVPGLLNQTNTALDQAVVMASRHYRVSETLRRAIPDLLQRDAVITFDAASSKTIARLEADRIVVRVGPNQFKPTPWGRRFLKHLKDEGL